MQRFPSSPREIGGAVWRNRGLIGTLVWRDVTGRYRGSMLGMTWSLIHPVLMLCVYTFVFSVVFNARWHPGSESRTEFAMILFAGLLVFNLFSECVNRAPGLILAHPSYVKKVVFPLEVLPVVALGSALFHAFSGFAVWTIFHLAVSGVPHATALLLPLMLLPVALCTLGLCWFLAALGVYLRDVGQGVTVVTTALMFLSPVFYPSTALPLAVQPLLALNPLTPAIEQVRGVLVFGAAPSLPGYAGSFAVAFAIAWLGFVWFQKTRKGFADVI